LAAQRVASLEGKGLAVEWARELAQGRAGLIRMETADPSFDTPAHIIAAAKGALERGHTHYTDFQGSLELREAIAERLEAEAGVAYDPAGEILVTSGTAESIYIAVQGVINPGDEVILTDPTYLIFEPNVLLAGGVVVWVPLVEQERWALDVAALRDSVGPRTRAILLNSPNNPTGSVFSRAELEQVAEVALQYDLVVIFDLLFDKLIFAGSVMENIASIPGMKARTVLLGGFSKVYSMCGFRVGWLAADAELVSELTNTLHLYVSICASPVSQQAAIAALRGPQDWLDEWLSSYQRRRDWLVEALNRIEGIQCQVPRGGYFAFPDISGIEPDAYRFAERLIDETGVVVTPGPDYGPQGQGHVRMVFGAASEDEVREAAARMQRALPFQ
jgi:aspartate/methionine/tyrosine aminotransferase